MVRAFELPLHRIEQPKPGIHLHIFEIGLDIVALDIQCLADGLLVKRAVIIPGLDSAFEGGIAAPSLGDSILVVPESLRYSLVV